MDEVSDGRTGDAGGVESELLGGSAERSVYRALLRNGQYRNLFFAMLTSSLGDWIGVFAILSLTEKIEGTGRQAAFALASVMIARVLPTLLIGPVAGVFADRWDRKRTMIATDLGRGTVMVMIAFAGDAFQLFVATFVVEVMSMLFIPAKDATVPNVVAPKRLVQANQLSLMVTYGTLPLGAGLFAALAALAVGVSNGGFLADRPQALAIWLNAATFGVSALFIARMKFPRHGRRSVPGGTTPPTPSAEESHGSLLQDLKEGLEFVTSHRLVRALVVGVMAAFTSAGVVFAVGPLFARQLNALEDGFGILGTVVGVGLFGGLLLAAPLSKRLDKERLFAPGIGLAGVMLIVVALMPRLDLAALPAAVMGVGAGLAFLVGYTMLQEYSDDSVRGRTFAAFNTGARVALFVALVVGPATVAAIGRVSPGADGVYPYAIDGVRITLMLAGATALIGAVFTGRALYHALEERKQRGLDLHTGELPAMPSRHGLFIVFEGGEGAGKSTQIRLLRAAVEKAGFDAVTTREPGGTTVGELIRGVLLDPESDIAPRTEALLYAAARAQHADDVIRPALEKGQVVLSDRYMDSSIVYQGSGRHLGEAQVEELNRWGTVDLMPDLVVLLDIDPEEGLRRVGGDLDRLEAAGLPFHREVNEAFRRRAAMHPDRYLVLDATSPAEELHREIRERVLDLLGVPVWYDPGATPEEPV